MSLPHIALMFLVPCVFLVFTSAVSTGRTYTLFPGSYTWNEVKDICNTSGLAMLRIDSEQERISFSHVLQQWKKSEKLTTNVWTGLFGVDATPINKTIYQWQGTCDLLGDYQPWDDGEPDEQQEHLCVAISATHTDQVYFKTDQCNQLYHAVCVQNSGRCTFHREDVDVSKYGEVASSLYLVEEDCKKSCRSLNDICVGFSRNPTSVTLCTLYAKNDAPVAAMNNEIYMNTKLCTNGICQFNEGKVKKGDYDEIFEDLVPQSKDICEKKCQDALDNNCVGFSALPSHGVNCTLYTHKNTTEATSRNYIPVFLKWCNDGVYNDTLPLVQRNNEVLPQNSCGDTTEIIENWMSQGHSCEDDAFRPMCFCEEQRTVQKTAAENPDHVEELQMAKEVLSSYRRSKTSAEDDRPSAVSIGVMGISVLVSVAVAVIVMDLNKFVSWVKTMNAMETPMEASNGRGHIITT